MLTLEFIKLVRDMRAAQRAYFAQRTRSALQAAKTLESRVDREIALTLQNIAVQSSLEFNEMVNDGIEADIKAH